MSLMLAQSSLSRKRLDKFLDNQEIKYDYTAPYTFSNAPEKLNLWSRCAGKLNSWSRWSDTRGFLRAAYQSEELYVCMYVLLFDVEHSARTECFHQTFSTDWILDRTFRPGWMLNRHWTLKGAPYCCDGRILFYSSLFTKTLRSSDTAEDDNKHTAKHYQV